MVLCRSLNGWLAWCCQKSAFRSTLADAGQAALAIPDAAIDAVREFDRSIDAALKGRLCPTGIIVFRKPRTSGA